MTIFFVYIPVNQTFTMLLFSGGWKVGVGVTFGVVGLVVIAVAIVFMLKKYKPE